MNHVISPNASRVCLLLCMFLSVLHAVASEQTCGASSTPCKAGCWNPSARIQADGIRFCEPVSPGYYSPDGDDVQYACNATSLGTETSPCNPCSASKQWLLRGPAGCSSSNAIHQDLDDNSPLKEVNQFSRRNAEKKSDPVTSLKYVLIFSFLVVCFIYIRARIMDCRTRRKNTKTRPIPPPPSDPKPSMSESAVAVDAGVVGDGRAAAEVKTMADIEQG